MESDRENSCSEDTHTEPRLVERRTGLRGLGTGSIRPPKNAVWKNTEDDLRERDPDIPYLKFEKVLRDRVCSLMERQDRMNEELLQRIVDLQPDGRPRSRPCSKSKEADQHSRGPVMEISLAVMPDTRGMSAHSGSVYGRLPGRLMKKLDCFERKIAAFPQRRWL